MPWTLFNPELFFLSPAAQAGQSLVAECWEKPFFPELCCQPPEGARQCFPDNRSDFVRCCAPYLEREHGFAALPPLAPTPAQTADATAAAASASASATDDPPPLLKVDLVVRTWHKDYFMLEVLLTSLSIFWPFNRFQTKVNVVLDAEAPESESVCREITDRFRAFAFCYGEPLPPWADDEEQPNRPKAARVHWSTFYSDLYVDDDVEYIGVLDTDVIFHNFGIDALLFAPPWRNAAGMVSLANRSRRPGFRGQVRPRPVIAGSWSSTFAFSALAVQDEYPEANFMESLPMVIRKEDFAAVRDHIAARFSHISGRDLEFDEAFLLAYTEIDKFAASAGWFLNWQGEFLCFQSAMGLFLWRWRQGDYHFSISGGVERGLPPKTVCPTLFPALHVTELKRAALLNVGIDYREEARGMMAAGLCRAFKAGVALPLASTNPKRNSFSAARCNAIAYEASKLLASADDVTGPRWWANDERCGPRSLSELLAAHERLILRDGPLPFAALQWVLGGNATGWSAYLRKSGSSTAPVGFWAGMDRLEVLIG